MKLMSKKQSNFKEYLTAREIAKALSLHPQYVRDCARMGIIPGMKIGSNWRFSLIEVEAKMKQNAAVAVERSLLASSPTKND